MSMPEMSMSNSKVLKDRGSRWNVLELGDLRAAAGVCWMSDAEFVIEERYISTRPGE
jgi:hypothetical protein